MAKDFNNQINLTDKIEFSDDCLASFELHHGIRRLDDASYKQKLADHVAANFFFPLTNEHDFTAEEIQNADETGSFWHCSLSSTLAGSNESNATRLE